jgi:Trk-type K+ transport system membrane component
MKKILNGIRSIFFGSATRGFVTIYALFMLLVAALLKMPASLVPGQTLSWIDAIFISASGISTTGLSTVVVADTLSSLGKVVLALGLQFGGIGLIMLLSIIWMVVGKKISYKERTMIMMDQNQFKMSGVVKLVKSVVIVLFSIELIAFIIMGMYLHLSGYYALKDAFFQSFFLTISLTTNAGFDISGTSFTMYHQDYFMQILGMFLMFVGAVGFWPIMEFADWVKSKIKKEKFEFSWFTKTLVGTHIALWIVGTILFLVLEGNNYLADKNIIESIFYGLFMSITTRNAGFSTIADISVLSSSTKFLFMILMFIGSSPNSAGGGIRTTTLIVIIFSVIAYARGKNQVSIGKKAFKDEHINKAVVVFIAAIALVLFASFLLMAIEPFSWERIMFEVSSAFGTTGLSLGITPYLSLFGKIILIITMFLGRIGMVTLLFIFKDDHKKINVQYPEVEVIIG